MKGLCLLLALPALSEVEGMPDAGRRESGFRPQEVKLLRSLTLAQTRTYAVAFSPDGRRLAAGGDGMTVVFDTLSWRELYRLKPHAGGVYGLAFSPDGRKLATAGARDGSIRLWEAASGLFLRDIKTGVGVHYRIAFHPLGAAALVAGEGDLARVLDVERGDVVASLAGHQGLSYAIAFGGGGRRAATSTSDGRIHVWRSEDWTREWTAAAQGGLVYALMFSRDGTRLLAGGGAGQLALWDVATGRELRALKGLQGDVRGAAFSPNGRHVISASGGSVRIWDASSGLEVRRLDGKKGTSFELSMHPAGSMFAVGGDDGLLDVYGR